MHLLPETRCSLFVLLARQAPMGLIFRRGPSTWTELSVWNTRTDVVERGQWFRGRVYERRCDLSPSGQKLIYFAAKHHLRNVDPAYSSTWTAISKTPYFTALVLWPNAGTTYHGGGLFDAEDAVCVNSVYHRGTNPERDLPAPVHPSHKPPKTLRVFPMSFASGDRIMARRLVRDGWSLATDEGVEAGHLDFKGKLVREVKDRRLTLDLGYQTMRYALFERASGTWQPRPFENVAWADFDQRGRLVFARAGRLFAVSTPQRHEASEEDLLADLTEGKPRSIVAPPSAQTW